MAEMYKLPGSSYEELIKIIKAYSLGKSGVAVSLDELVQATGTVSYTHLTLPTILRV